MVYTFTYTDCANHTHAWTYTYTIAAPVISLNCPLPQFFCEVAGNNYTIGAPTASDNCGKPINITFVITGATTRSGSGDASGIFNLGVSTITWTADNGCTTASCSTTVTINNGIHAT